MSNSWFNTSTDDVAKIDYSKFKDDGKGAGAVWDGVGKALKTFGALNQAYGENDDAIALASLTKSGDTSTDHELYDATNQTKFDTVIKENKQKADNGILSQVMSGALTKENLPQINNPIIQQKANTYFNDNKSKENLAKATEMVSSGIPTKDIVNSFDKGTLDTTTLQFLIGQKNVEDKMAFDKIKYEAINTTNTNNNIRNNNSKTITIKQTPLQKQNTQITKNMTDGILNQKDPTKTKVLNDAQTQLNNGAIDETKFKEIITPLIKEPLESKVKDEFSSRMRYLSTLRALQDENKKGNLKSNTGVVDSMLPSVLEDSIRIDSHLKGLLLGKTDQLAGTLTQKDMDLLQQSGLTEKLSDEDFVKALNKYEKSLSKSIQDDYSEYSTKFDIDKDTNTNYNKYFGTKKEQTKSKKISVVKQQKQIVQTGMSNGKKVIKFSDGSIEYAN